MAYLNVKSRTVINKDLTGSLWRDVGFTYVVLLKQSIYFKVVGDCDLIPLESNFSVESSGVDEDRGRFRNAEDPPDILERLKFN